MAVNNFNNSIGFPRLTNNTSGMFMTLPLTQSSVNVEVKQEVKPEIAVSTPFKQGKKSDNTNYYLGAAALAASVIAGILIYRGKKSTETAETVIEEVQQKVNIFAEHIKDNFLESLKGKCPELGLENKKEHTFQKLVRVDKNGKSILKAGGEKQYVSRGLKKVDEIIAPAGLKQTTYVTDDGKELAKINWDDDGNVFDYIVKDRNGNVIRDFNVTNPDVTTKFVYNKENIKIAEVQYNGKGWSHEQKFDESGNFLSEKEFNPELKNADD